MASGYLPLFLLAPVDEWRCAKEPRSCALVRPVGATARGTVVEVWRRDPQPAFVTIEIPFPLGPGHTAPERVKAEFVEDKVRIVARHISSGGSGSGGSGSGDGAVVTAVPPDAWIPAPASSRVRDRPGLDVVEDVEHE